MRSRFFTIRNLLVVGIISLSVVCVVLLHDIELRLDSLHNRTLPGVAIAGEMRNAPDRFQLLVLEVLLDGSAQRRSQGAARFEALQKEMEQNLRDYRSTVVVSEDRNNLDRLRTTYGDYVARAEAFLRPTKAATAQHDIESLRVAYQAFDASSALLYTFKRGRAEMWSETSFDRASAAIRLNLGILLAALLLGSGLLIGAILSRRPPETPSDF